MCVRVCVCVSHTRFASHKPSPFTPTPCGTHCQSTSKFSRHCNDDDQEDMLPLLVTGSGKSGLSFVLNVLKELGVQATDGRVDFGTSGNSSQHDGKADISRAQAVVGWPYLIKADKYPRPWNQLDGKLFGKVFHLVRHPLYAIAEHAAAIQWSRETTAFVEVRYLFFSLFLLVCVDGK